MDFSKPKPPGHAYFELLVNSDGISPDTIQKWLERCTAEQLDFYAFRELNFNRGSKLEAINNLIEDRNMIGFGNKKKIDNLSRAHAAAADASQPTNPNFAEATSYYKSYGIAGVPVKVVGGDFYPVRPVMSQGRFQSPLPAKFRRTTSTTAAPTVTSSASTPTVTSSASAAGTSTLCHHGDCVRQDTGDVKLMPHWSQLGHQKKIEYQIRGPLKFGYVEWTTDDAKRKVDCGRATRWEVGQPIKDDKWFTYDDAMMMVY